MVDRIKNKVAVVIGASQGIGEGIAIRLAEEGAKLVRVMVWHRIIR